MPNLIYCKIPVKRTIKSFLRAGFTGDRSNIRGKFVVTYSDEKCTKQECYPARRSFGDLYLITKSKYPNITEELLAYRLLQMIKSKSLLGMYCPQIRKIVFWKPEHTEKYFDFTKDQRYGKALDFLGEDKVSVTKLMDLASSYQKNLKSIGNKRV
jgi:hypothetical protein